MYDATSHTVTTVNFAFPNIVTYGNGMIALKVKNPYDSRSTSLTFETYDSQGRQIGITKNAFTYNAIPKPLNIQLSKTSNNVGTSFTLTANLTLSTNIGNGDYIEVILPESVNYQTEEIKCISAGMDLNCDKQFNEIGQLVIKIIPRCSDCTPGAQIKFSVTNLLNPAYINEINNMIFVNIRTALGVREAKEANIDLVPSDVQVDSYTQEMNANVGKEIPVVIKFVPSPYIIDNQGIITIQFTEGEKYISPLTEEDGALTGNNYYLKVEQTGATNGELVGSVQYANDNPSSIKQISINICDGEISKCTSGNPI